MFILKTDSGEYFCYRNDGHFGYEWVSEEALKARQSEGLISFLEERHAEKEICMALSPKEVDGWIRPDYPDMSDAFVTLEEDFVIGG